MTLNELGECTERGTWGEILGFRHLAGEHKLRRMKRIIPVEEKYFDKEYLGGEKNVLEEYWKTKDIKILENCWWDKVIIKGD